jgi:hypothetical protein
MSWIVDLVVFQHKRIFKSMFWIGIICFGIFAVWGYAVSWSLNESAAPPINNNPVVSTPAGVVVTPLPMDIINVDNEVLKRNGVYPVPFQHDLMNDPVGAYFANLNFGLGPFPAVYILPDKWIRSGGRIVQVNSMPVSGFYYSVFTSKGTSSQVIYDKQKNIVYSMVDTPEILRA